MRRVNLGTTRRINRKRRVGEQCNSVAILRITYLVFWIDRVIGTGMAPEYETALFSRFLVTATNSTLNITSNATIDTKRSNSFCVLPNDTSWSAPYHSCKMESETWKGLLSPNDSSNQNRSGTTSNVTSEESIDENWTGECGPQCRPSCITLLLDLDRLSIDNFLCPNGASCSRPCEHISQSTCRSSDTDALYQQYPKCFLEEAQCYGPTMYEDIAALYESRLPTNNRNDSLPPLDHCTVVPREDFYQRFQGWNVISPMNRRQDNCSDNTTSTNCFNRTSKIYFEYCNAVEEDYMSCRSCQATNGKTCLDNQQCPKIIQPFPDGWTTFVVSASIPFPDNDRSCHRDSTTNDTGVDAVCFLQRIQLYYPTSCPHCHTCPQISLGDTFGPLEVVGFGHAIQQNCAPCHRPSIVSNLSAHALSCEAIERCHESVDCHSGTSLGLPSFLDNKCSFQPDVDEDFTDDILTPLPERNFSTLSPTDVPVMMTMLPSLSPENGKITMDQNDTLADNQTAMPDDNDPPAIEHSPAASPNHRLSPLVVSLIVTGLAIVVGVQLALYRKMMTTQRDAPRRIAEEIVYIEPLEFDGLDKMLASDAGSDHTAADEDPTVDSDVDNPSSSWSPPWRTVSPPEKLQQEIRHFQTASILERSDQNEVEALYMTGQHHIQLTS
jgi:hypothetical protein